MPYAFIQSLLLVILAQTDTSSTAGQIENSIIYYAPWLLLNSALCELLAYLLTYIISRLRYLREMTRDKNIFIPWSGTRMMSGLFLTTFSVKSMTVTNIFSRVRLQFQLDFCTCLPLSVEFIDEWTSSRQWFSTKISACWDESKNPNS